MADPLEEPVRPVDDDLVGEREARLGGKDLPGVAHGHAVAEHLGQPDQGGGEVDGAEDEHAGRRRKALDEHRHLVPTGLPPGPVVADARRTGLQLRLGVPADDAVEVAVAERAPRLDAGLDEQRSAGARTGHHGGEGDGPLGPQCGGEVVEDRRGAAHQSRRSTKRCIVPPQVRPTANASSSL